MTQLNGFFELRTPTDLVAKLEHDFHRLQKVDPATRDAQYVAFDFFVTADHVADWVATAFGGSKAQRREYEHGALVFHIASGAKHFRVTDERHTTAKDTRISRAYGPSYQLGAFQGASLVIDLEDGTIISVNEVAKVVLEYWKRWAESGRTS